MRSKPVLQARGAYLGALRAGEGPRLAALAEALAAAERRRVEASAVEVPDPDGAAA